MGRHRKPSYARRNAVRIAAAAGVAASPLAFPGTASAGMPDNIRQAIIACESGGNPKAQNNTSTASGLYQFINGTWKAFGGSTPRARDASVAEQHRVADRAFAANGLRDWEADPRSEACWRPKIGRHASGREAPRHATTEAAVEHAQSDPEADSPDADRTYTVRRGDTLGKIAAREHTTVAALFAANRAVVEHPDLIFPGERLHV